MAKQLFFELLSDVLDVQSMTVWLPAEAKTIAGLVDAQYQRGCRWQRYPDAGKLQITVNRQFCDAGTEIANSNEIGFISRPGTI